MQREISLARSGRRYFNVGGLLGPQTVPKRVEDLSLGEAAGSSRHIRREIFCAGHERANAKLLSNRIPHAVQPKGCRRIVAPAMAFTAGVAHHHVPTQSNLSLHGSVGPAARKASDTL